MPVPLPEPYDATSRTLLIDGLETHYFEAGTGPTIMLLHSGEFGSCAELSWEYNIARLSRDHRVIAPDWVGYGRTAKIHDFVDFSAFKVRHMAKFCEELGIADVPFIGNSMAANFLIRDAAAEEPLLPASAIVAISGGGPVPQNEARAALVDYDCSTEGMRKLLSALFHDPVWATDDDYIARRHELSLIPGAWECASAARLRSPAATTTALDRVRSNALDYSGVRVPILLVAGAEDKLKPRGYATDLAEQIPGAEAIEVPGTGHCPHIETPEIIEVFLDFITRRENQ